MRSRVITSLLFLAMLSSSLMYADVDPKNKGSLAKPETTVPFAKRIVQGFNMRVWLSNKMTMGIQAWDVGVGTNIPQEPHLGLEYPLGENIEHLYGGGPWIGGRINGIPHVDEGYNGNDARNEFIPEFRHVRREHFWHTYVGASEQGLRDTIGYSGYYYNNHVVVDRAGCDNDGDGKVNEDDLDGFDNDGDWNPLTDDVGADGLPDSLEVSCNELKYDPVTNPDPAQDNYAPTQNDLCRLPDANGNLYKKNDKDYYTEKNGIPDHGEPHVDEDYGAISDRDYYCAATDTFRTPVLTDHFPMHIKVIQKSYAWRGDVGDGILPMDYYFVNVGRYPINDVYVGFFMDIDLGPVSNSNYINNDYAAYLDSLRTAYIHNPVDRGSTPLGLTVLGTPRSLDSLLYVFQWFDFGTSPGPGTDDSAIYYWMSGGVKPWIKPNQNPTDLSDTRFMFSFGQKPDDPTDSKFKHFMPGDTIKISVALVSGLTVGEGSNNLKQNAEKALKLFSRGYTQPVTPTAPPLTIDQGFKRVTLRWHQDSSKFFQSLAWDDSNKLAESYRKINPHHWRIDKPPCQTTTGGCSGHTCTTKIDSATGQQYQYLPGGRIFSGYRIYRSEDQGNTPNLNSFALLKEIQLNDSANYSDLVRFNEDSTTFVDSNLVRGRRYWYAITTFGIPDITLLPVVTPEGGVRYDTLFSNNSESPITDQLKRVDLRFDADTLTKSVLVVPNPYRVDRSYIGENGGYEKKAQDGWTENDRLIRFIHLPTKCTIRIFTLAGDLIKTVEYDAGALAASARDPQIARTGQQDVDLLSDSNRAIASGVYIFTVESTLGTQVGKFVIIR